MANPSCFHAHTKPPLLPLPPSLPSKWKRELLHPADKVRITFTYFEHNVSTSKLNQVRCSFQSCESSSNALSTITTNAYIAKKRQLEEAWSTSPFNQLQEVLKWILDHKSHESSMIFKINFVEINSPVSSSTTWTAATLSMRETDERDKNRDTIIPTFLRKAK